MMTYDNRVKWLGLDATEASWEPALALYEDIPVLFRRFCAKHAAKKKFKAMVNDLELALGHLL